MRHFILTALMAASFGLVACTNTDMSSYNNKKTGGAVIGAVAGGVLGSNVGGGKGQLVATGVGTLLGALVGSSIGQSLDRADMVYAQQANSRAHSAPIGETVSWTNPQTGNKGTVTPVNDYKATTGRYCREYQQTIYIDGQAQTGYGTACQNADGTWQVQNS